MTAQHPLNFPPQAYSLSTSLSLVSCLNSRHVLPRSLLSFSYFSVLQHMFIGCQLWACTVRYLSHFDVKGQWHTVVSREVNSQLWCSHPKHSCGRERVGSITGMMHMDTPLRQVSSFSSIPALLQHACPSVNSTRTLGGTFLSFDFWNLKVRWCLR